MQTEPQKYSFGGCSPYKFCYFAAQLILQVGQKAIVDYSAARLKVGMGSETEIEHLPIELYIRKA